MQDLAGMLAEARRDAAQARGRAAEPIGRAGQGDRLAGWRLWLYLEIADGGELRVLHEVGDGVDRRDRDLPRLAFAIKLLLAASAAERAEDFSKTGDALRRLAELEILPLRLEQRGGMRHVGLGNPAR